MGSVRDESGSERGTQNAVDGSCTYLRCSLDLETPGLGDECERGVTGYLEVSALPSLS